MNVAIDRPRKILLLQDHAETGGAAVAARRFGDVLQSMGLQVTVVAGDGGTQTKTIRLSGKPPRGPSRVLEFCIPSSVGQRLRRTRVQKKWSEILQVHQPDLVWAHNLHGGQKWGWHWNLLSLAMAQGPMLWTLHDMWALGDGPCYFPPEQLMQRWPHSPLYALQQSTPKKKFLLLTPSVWLRDLARTVATGPVEVWANPLDVGKFHPGPRERVRKELGLRDGEFMVLAAAENLADPRKGIGLLEKAWQEIRNLETTRLGLIGRNAPLGLQADPRVFLFGSVAAESRVAELMAAADLFVHPAAMESHGLVLEESQACGTPVLAGLGSGMDEAASEGAGWRLRDVSVLHLAHMIRQILKSPVHLRAMRPIVRQSMERKHSSEALSLRWEFLQHTLRSMSVPAEMAA